MSARRGTEWSAQDEFMLRKLYRNTSNPELAELFGRQPKAIGLKARKMGLKKSERFQKARCFPRGHEPFNKGRPAVEWNPNLANCRKTQFQKGQLSGRARALLKPVGTTRVNKSGLLERKTTDGGPYPAARWTPVHRTVWESANGPVPAGCLVVFKPGKATAHEPAITCDRLEVITRAENMRRNSYHNRYPKEVARLIQLRGALNRKLNRRIGK